MSNLNNHKLRKKCHESLFITFAILICNLVFPSQSLRLDASTIAEQDNEHQNTVSVWNNLTTRLGTSEKLSPVEFSRVYR